MRREGEVVKGTLIHGPGDIRFEERPDPTIANQTDAIVAVSATCVCGSDLWRYRGLTEVDSPSPIGHEFTGMIVEVGMEVTTLDVGDFVIGPFLHSCGTCGVCRVGMHANCPNGGSYDGCQSELIRVPNADGSLVATPSLPSKDMVPSLLTLSDVMGTGWHAAISAGVKQGSTVAVVGDGAVGLCGVLAARTLGASTIIAMSRHADRQRLATEFGATHIVPERGEAGIDRVREITGGTGVDCVLEAVGTDESLAQAVGAARPGGQVGWVGLPHVAEFTGITAFRKNVGLRGGIAPVRAYLPHLLDLVLDGTIKPGRVFDLHLDLASVRQGYEAMDERRSIKTLLWANDEGLS